MLRREQLDQLWRDVQGNRRILDACQHHDFSIDLSPTRTIGKQWQCCNCGGHVDSMAKHWFEVGIAHGRQQEG